MRFNFSFCLSFSAKLAASLCERAPARIHWHFHCVLISLFARASSIMADAAAVAEGVRAAELLQAERDAKQSLDTLLARAGGGNASTGYEESEPDEEGDARSVAGDDAAAATPVVNNAMTAFMGKVAKKFKSSDETVQTAVDVLQANGIDVGGRFRFPFTSVVMRGLYS